jgi:NAD(P)-dependent dehydrogenase (short-subunit alcohol dehydrogenase family)
MKRLKDKVIVISGGTKGVGKAAALAFAKEGATVVVGGRDESAANNIIKQIRQFGTDALFVATDLNSVEACNNLFDVAYNTYQHIDGFFNYAGITPVSPLDNCDQFTFDQVMNINFRACFFCCQQAIKYMRLNKGGSIVLTGSAHAWRGHKDRAAYACSKGALLTLNEHIANNYASEQIRCNYLTLGWTPTEGEIALRKTQGESEAQLRERAAKILPMGKMLEITDYIESLIYLMSDYSKIMTGSILRLTAGEYI